MTNSTHRNRLRQCAGGPFGDVDNLLQQFFGPVASVAQSAAQAASWRAPVSVWEADDRLHVEVDAPGVQKQDAEISYDKGQLSLTLRRNAPESREYHHNERGYGELTRTLSLPETVDPNTLEAELTDGVLRISVAKRPEAQPKRVELK